MSNCFKFTINPGFLMARLTDEQLAPVWAEVRRIQADWTQGVPANTYLAGNIEKEFNIDTTPAMPCVNEILQPLVAEYVDAFDYAGVLQQLTTNVPVVVSDLWVNFQKKHEFNPPHNHSGVFSFVIWLQIPYLMADEHAAGPGAKGTEPQNGDFVLHYTDSTGLVRWHRMGADRTRENHILMFPNTMVHHVNPFYSSDDYRITVAGNMKFLAR